MARSEEDHESDPDDPGTPKKRRLQRGSEVSKEEKPKHRSQKYRKAWESEGLFKSWLFPCANDETKARCSSCAIILTAEKSVLKVHAQSKGHLKKFTPPIDRENRKQPSVSSLFKQNTEITSLKSKAIDVEIKLSSFFAERNIPFNVTDHLDELLKNCFPDSNIAKEFTLKRKKVRGIVTNVIGQNEKEELARRLRKRKFSFMVDESTDISGGTAMCTVVRSYNQEKDKIESRFWDLHQLYKKDNQIESGATGESLYEGIMESFTSYNIPKKNMVGFGGDGASVLMGNNNSVKSRLKRDCPGIFVMRCICHSIHLCASEACKALPSRCEELARAVYNFFKFSAKRSAQLKKFQEFLNLDHHAMLHPSQTRWLSLLAVVQRLLAQWNALTLYFTDVSLSEGLLTGTQILEYLRDPFIKLYFYFLQWVLPKFTELNKHFQSSKVVVLDLHKDVQILYNDILMVYMERKYVICIPIEKIDPSNHAAFKPDAQLYLGCDVASLLLHKDVKDCAERKTEFFQRCRQFLVIAAVELKKRWDFNDPVLTQIKSLTPSLALSNFHRDMVPSIQPLADSLPRIKPEDPLLLQEIDDQWRRLPLADLPPEIRSETEADVFWSKILKWEEGGVAPFAALADFALDALIIPHANCDCERIFSQINMCKTKVRNRLVVPTINGLLLTSECVKSSTCVKFSPSDEMRRRMTAANFYGPTQASKPTATASTSTSASTSWSSGATSATTSTEPSFRPSAGNATCTTTTEFTPDDPDDLVDEELFF